MVLSLADPCNFGMVVKNFGGKKVDFTRQQHAHHQGARPVFAPAFTPASQLDGFALSRFRVRLPTSPRPTTIIPNNLPPKEFLNCPFTNYNYKDARPRR
jgi:hypothetical protein